MAIEDATAAYQRDDYATALSLFRSLAKQDDAAGQNMLGVMYDGGEGVAQDYAEAVRWFRLAAEQGYAVAQFNLGSMYEDGVGVPKNYVLAHMWFNLATARATHPIDGWYRHSRDAVAAKMTPD